MKVKEIKFFIKIKDKEYLSGMLSNYIVYNRAIEIDNNRLEKLKEEYTYDKLLDFAKKETYYDTLFKDEVIESIELIYLVKRTTFRYGEYYAHEYDKWVEGKQRELIYSNGFIEYETKCLDSELCVLDGIWDEDNGNGCGDRFE